MTVENRPEGFDLPGIDTESITDSIGDLAETLNFDEIIAQIEELLENVMATIESALPFDFFDETPDITPETFGAVASAMAADHALIDSLDIPLARNAAMQNVLEDIPELQYYIGSFQGIGGRPAAVVTHRDFDPNQPYKIIYHFHGTHGQDPGYNDRFQRTMETFEQRTGPQTVIVYGLSSEERSRESSRYEYDHEWPEDMELYHNEALSVVEDRFGADASNCKQVIVEGHSAGGLALRNCAEQGFEAKYVSLDATYGDWGEEMHQFLEQHGIDPDIEVYLATETTEEDAGSLLTEEGVVVHRASSHGRSINEGLGGSRISEPIPSQTA